MVQTYQLMARRSRVLLERGWLCRLRDAHSKKGQGFFLENLRFNKATEIWLSVLDREFFGLL